MVMVHFLMRRIIMVMMHLFMGWVIVVMLFHMGVDMDPDRIRISVHLHMMMVMTVKMQMHMPMRMIMHLFAFFFVIYRDSEMSPLNAAFHRVFLSNCHARDPESVHFCDESIRVRQQFQKSGCQHITGSAHSAVNK